MSELCAKCFKPITKENSHYIKTKELPLVTITVCHKCFNLLSEAKGDD